MAVGLPCRAVAVVRLVAPRRPVLARAAREQFQVRAGAARLDERILLVGLARVLTLARRQEIDLPAARRQRAGVLALHAEQHELGDVAEIEADTAPVGAAIFSHLVPDDVGLVGEAPRLHPPQSFRRAGRWDPQDRVAGSPW